MADEIHAAREGMMRTHIQFRQSEGNSGYALMLVLAVTAASLLALSAALDWAANSARQTQRNLQFKGGGAAAEAAVQRSIGQVVRDFFDQGEDYVTDRLSTYRKSVPTTSESKTWATCTFTDLKSRSGRVNIEKSDSWKYDNLPGRYNGMRGYNVTYEIACAATDTAIAQEEPVAARQTVTLAQIPVSNFGVLYWPDLEVCPGSTFTQSGRVHANANIYLEPQAELTFNSHVTATGRIFHNRSPKDPVQRSLSTVKYQGRADSGLNSFYLPVGTNNSANAMRALVEVPPLGESATSVLGAQRFYNKADLVILVYSNKVTATSGLYNKFATTISTLITTGVIRTNVLFFDKRQNRTVRTTELDMAKFSLQFGVLTAALNREPDVVYIADLRTADSVAFPAVRIINGQTLPGTGWTLATPNPLYVKGHFNANSYYLGTTNTLSAIPAALAADAITILSPGWDDGNATKELKHRKASDVTINAALLAGVVPTGNGYYSGGLENYLRLLEDWSGSVLTFNGSLAALYDSRIATAPWGATADIYQTPKERRWNYDFNLLTESRCPPAMPQVRMVIRGQLEVATLEAMK